MGHKFPPHDIVQWNRINQRKEKEMGHYNEIIKEDRENAKREKRTTQDKISTLFANYEEFLKEKTLRYGDRAMNPIGIFSKGDSEKNLLTRIDDKLSRIKNSEKLRKNDVSDLFGYIALLMIEQGWDTFNEFLD